MKERARPTGEELWTISGLDSQACEEEKGEQSLSIPFIPVA